MVRCRLCGSEMVAVSPEGAPLRLFDCGNHIGPEGRIVERVALLPGYIEQVTALVEFDRAALAPLFEEPKKEP